MRDQRISISNFLGVELLLLLVVFPMCFMSIAVNALDDDVEITEGSHPPLPAAANLDKENSRNKRSVMELGSGILMASNTESITENKRDRSIRNVFSGLCLSVADNYLMETPCESPRQKWEFVDGGWLRNDKGKCLAGSGWYVQPVDCAYNLGKNGRWKYIIYAGPTAFREIKSKDGYCLSSAADTKHHGYVYYDYCRENEPRQRWWHNS